MNVHLYVRLQRLLTHVAYAQKLLAPALAHTYNMYGHIYLTLGIFGLRKLHPAAGYHHDQPSLYFINLKLIAPDYV